MGEIADSILEGAFCQECGEYMGEGDGFPVSCAGCRGGKPQPESFRTPILDSRTVTLTLPANTTVRCHLCNKKVRAIGYNDHQRDAHRTSDRGGK